MYAQSTIEGVYISSKKAFVPKDKQFSVAKFDPKLEGICYQKLKVGLIDTNGHVILPFLYKNVMRLEKSKHWVLVSNFNQQSFLISLKDTSIKYPTYGLPTFETDEQQYFQVIEQDGQYSTFDIVKSKKVYGPISKPLINVEPYGFKIAGPYPSQYESLRNERSMWRSSDTNWYAYLDTNFKQTTPFLFKGIRYDQHNKEFVIRNDANKGLLDSSGKMIFEPKYDGFNHIWMNPRYLAVQQDGFSEPELIDQDGMSPKRGGIFQLYTNDGTLFSKDTFKEVQGFNTQDQVFIVTREGRNQILDIPKDAELVPATPIYYVANAKMNLLSLEGKYLLPQNVEDIKSLSNHNYLIEQKKEYSIYNSTTKKFISLKKYKYCSDEFEFIRASTKDSIYILNSSGVVLGQSKEYYSPHFYRNVCVVYRGGYYGVVNSQNKIVLPCKYDSLIIKEDDARVKNAWLAIAGKKDAKGIIRMGIVDSMNKIKIPFEYDDIRFNENGKAKYEVKKNEKSGILDSLGNKILPCQFSEIQYVHDGDTYISATLDGKGRYYDFNGKILKSGNYEYSYGGYNYQEIESPNGKVNVLDQRNQPLLKNDVDEISHFTMDAALLSIKDHGKNRLVNNNGYDIIGYDVDNLDQFMMFKRGDSMFYLNENAEVVWLGDYTNITRTMTYYQTERKGKFGMMDFNYHVMLQPDYRFIYPRENYFYVGNDSMNTYIDSAGKVLLPWSKNGYTSIDQFIYTHNKDGCIQLFTKAFKQIDIDCYGSINVEMFHHKVVILKNTKRELLLLDLNGKPIYTEPILAFDIVQDSLYILKMKDKCFLTDEEAKRLSTNDYEDIQAFITNFLKVKKNGLFGIINSQGKDIIPCKYQKIVIEDYSSKTIAATDETGKVFLFNEKGEVKKE